MIRSVFAFFLTFFVLICVPAPLRAQTTATVTGTAADSSGGSLPGVQVTLVNQGTSLARSVTSAADGRFVFAGVPAGTYELKAELAGFRTVVRRDLVVTVAQTVSVPLVMSLNMRVR